MTDTKSGSEKQAVAAPVGMREMANESYPASCVRVVLMVSPDGELHAIDGKREDGDGDTAYVGLARINKKIEQVAADARREAFEEVLDIIPDSSRCDHCCLCLGQAFDAIRSRLTPNGEDIK